MSRLPISATILHIISRNLETVQGGIMVPPGPEAQATAGPYIYICNIELISEHDVMNSRSRSLYVIVRPSICLSVVCRLSRSCILLRRLKFSAVFLRHLVRRPSIDIQVNFKIVPGEPLRWGS